MELNEARRVLGEAETLPASVLKRTAIRILAYAKGNRHWLMGVDRARARALWMTMNSRTGNIRFYVSRADSTDPDKNVKMVGGGNAHPWQQGYSRATRPWRNKRVVKLPREEATFYLRKNAPKWMHDLLDADRAYRLIPDLTK